MVTMQRSLPTGAGRPTSDYRGTEARLQASTTYFARKRDPVVSTLGWSAGLRWLDVVGTLSYPGKLSEAQLLVQLQIHVTKWGGVF